MPAPGRPGGSSRGRVGQGLVVAKRHISCGTSSRKKLQMMQASVQELVGPTLLQVTVAPIPPSVDPSIGARKLPASARPPTIRRRSTLSEPTTGQQSADPPCPQEAAYFFMHPGYITASAGSYIQGTSFKVPPKGVLPKGVPPLLRNLRCILPATACTVTGQKE